MGQYDTSKQRRSEAYLSEAQRLSHTGSFGWCVVSGEIFWSDETFRIFQYDRTTQPSIEGILERTHPEDVAFVKRTIEQASREMKDFDFEHRLLMPDGSTKHLRVVGHAEHSGQATGQFVGAVMDVTVTKEAEQRIRHSERELRTTLETIPAAVVSTLPDGSVDFASQGWLDYIGVSKEQLLGWNWMQIIHPDDLEGLLNNWRVSLATGQPLEAETRVRPADGNYRWFMARGVALRDEAGEILKWYTTMHDIEDRKQVEQRLRQSEKELRTTLETIPAGVVSTLPDGYVDFVSQSWLDYVGSTREELLGWGWKPTVHPEDIDRVMNTWLNALTTGEPVEIELRHRRADGAYRWFLSRLVPARDESGKVVKWYSSTFDIEDRKRAEEALQKSRDRFQAMVEKSAEGILLILSTMGIDYASPSIERVLGYRPGEFIDAAVEGDREDRFQSRVEMHAYAHEQLLKLARCGLLEPDQLKIAMDTVAAVLEEPGRALTTEVMVRHKDGSSRWIEWTIRNLLDDPNVQALVVNFRDLTERKLAQAERERLEQRLRQAEKMEAVGRLAGGIAHDFNNVLAGIFAYGEMLFEETPADSELRRYARNVLIAATRGRALVEQILAYSSSQRGKRVAVDLVRVMDETLELISGSLPAHIQLEAGAPERSLVVIGDATQLHQVVMNLCSNAVHAMNGSGSLRVTLDSTAIVGDRGLSHGSLRSGDYVRLTVEDNGSGIDETTLPHIFEPFFTTKDIGRGTGLGLSLVYAIVTDGGGAIDVKSVRNHGSAFTIYLPLAQNSLTTADEAVAPPPRGNGECVLLIDDEAPLLAATAEVLARLGYKPVSFSDSQDALAAFEATPDRFDVVITDEVMPGLTGTALANEVRRHRPELPIVLLSGYSGTILTQQALAAGVSELLIKPLQSREIAATLVRVLGRTA